MNTQLNVILPVDLHQQIRDRAWEERKSTSALCRQLLRDAMSQHEQEQEQEQDIEKVNGLHQDR